MTNDEYDIWFVRSYIAQGLPVPNRDVDRLLGIIERRAADNAHLRFLLLLCRDVLHDDCMGMDERVEGARVLKDVEAAIKGDANA